MRWRTFFVKSPCQFPKPLPDNDYFPPFSLEIIPRRHILPFCQSFQGEKSSVICPCVCLPWLSFIAPPYLTHSRTFILAHGAKRDLNKGSSPDMEASFPRLGGLHAEKVAKFNVPRPPCFLFLFLSVQNFLQACKVEKDYKSLKPKW